MVPDQKRTKMDVKSRKLILVGYDGDSNNYRLFDHVSKSIVIISRNVVFAENPADEVKSDERSVPVVLNEQDTGTEDVDDEVVKEKEASTQNIQTKTGQNTKGLRPRENIRLPKRYELNLVEADLPQTYDEAIRSEDSMEWNKAIEEELSALEKNDTWEVVQAPSNKNIIGCKWVFKIKKKPNGDVERYKARLCAKGFSQIEGQDYQETFSPTARFDTIRLALANAAKEKHQVIQFDIKTAFLYGKLSEDIYMEIPPGIVENPNCVCKLRKSLYGLKQSPRNWNRRFKAFLDSFGLKSCDSDECTFKGSLNGELIIIVLYVNDGLIFTKTKETLNKVVNKLRSEFEVTFSEPSYFLGLQIECSEDGCIFIHLSNYINSLVKRFGLADAKTCGVPADPCTMLSQQDDGEDLSTSNIPYREAVGSLMFAAVTARPDIMYPVNIVSRFQNKFNNSHWNAVKRIIKYLKGTYNYGIKYNPLGCDIVGYSDADYASDVDTRKSTSRYVFRLADGAVTWKSCRQNCVSLSTTEAEFVAASEATKEAIWIKQVLSEIGEKDIKSVCLNIDNQSAIKLIKNPVFHSRTKHIDVRYNFIRDKYQNSEIDVKYVPSNEQLADSFTKGRLYQKQFKESSTEPAFKCERGSSVNELYHQNNVEVQLNLVHT